MANFSQNELVDMIFILGECSRNPLLASRIYKARYPERERFPKEESFKNLLERFIETGSVSYPQKQKRVKSIVNEENEFVILTALIENPHVSTRQLENNFNISKTSIRRIIKKNKFHPYRIQRHQELQESDYQYRLNFCNWVEEQLNENQNILDNIMFTDECTFHRNGFVNRHNFHYYSAENPHYFRVYSQKRWSLNVWAGIMGTTIIGPFFFDGNLNANKYFRFLQENLFELLENVPLAQIRNMIFQQDGAPPHHAGIVKEWLNNTFHEKWIGRDGPTRWPARSPDLTPLDYFLWGYVKEKVYKEETTTVEDMKIRIQNAFETITPEMLNKVKNEFRQRVRLCIDKQGRHFEHL